MVWKILSLREEPATVILLNGQGPLNPYSSFQYFSDQSEAISLLQL